MAADLNVLVAQPQRESQNPVFVERAQEIFDSFTYPHKTYAVHANGESAQKGEPKYAGHARARNATIDAHLQAQHTHVLWIDADIVTAPPDLIERLAGVSLTDVVAPLVYVELLDPADKPGPSNGGWFYDIGGFVYQGQWTKMWKPQWLNGHKIVEIDSVGCCYLIPAAVYREGIRYSAFSNRVEHEPFMAEVRASGRRVLVDTNTRIEHAFLPRFGESWH